VTGPRASHGRNVIVVGAGLAGLSAAWHLHRQGVGVTVVESSDDVGGRMRTDLVGGFRLYRGFHLYCTAFPEPARVLDVPALDLRFLDPEVAVWLEGDRVSVAHPWQRPAQASTGLRSRLGTPADMVRLATTFDLLATMPAERILAEPESSAENAWRQRGLSPRMTDRVLRPLLAGMLGETALSSSNRFVDLLLRAVARGRVGVPAAGIATVPRQIAAALPPGTIHLGVRVTGVSADRVSTEDGELPARAVVVATDPGTAIRLLPGLHEPSLHGLTTVYHAAPETPLARPVLVLDGSGQGPVTSTAVLSAVSSSYSPDRRALVVSTVVSTAAERRDLSGLEKDVRAHLQVLYGTDTSDWEHLRTYHLPQALPAVRPPHNFRRPVRVMGGLYVCGDHRDSSSVQGAMVSGRRAARAAAADLDD
jgi:phytoene dehydrogenase-like protein